jgi:hypothetical protein
VALAPKLCQHVRRQQNDEHITQDGGAVLAVIIDFLLKVIK